MAVIPLPYQDSSYSVEERVSDLLSRMTLEEKSGLLFHNMICPGPNGRFSGEIPEMGILDTVDLLENKLMSHFNLVGPITDARLMATWHNKLQQHVLDHTRLGIPITLSSDPRHQFSSNIGTGFKAGILSQWPEQWGFGALRDPALARIFGDCVRQEYTALGLRVSLHPQADLATEYRWARVQSTFGEDAELAGQLVAAYIEGMQKGLSWSSSESRYDGRDSVSTMTKHFPGSGPQKDGEDSHFTYGQAMVYPGENFEYHLGPFRDAIRAGTRHIMPAYGMPIGTKFEEVGMAFNKGIITGVLRNELGFTGIVCTDWGLLTDVVLLGQDMPARAWGCEHLSEVQRVVKILDAGCDQFGGESRPELVVQAVRDGLVSETRLDESVRRVLTEKFILGLFDDRRFVDVEAAVCSVGHSRLMELGRATQRRAFTVLINGNNAFPIPHREVAVRKFYVEGLLSENSAISRGLTLVSAPMEADVALLRVKAPYEPRPGGFESKFHAGSLEFPAKEVARLAGIIEKVPITMLDVYLDRPAILTQLVEVQNRVNQQRGRGRREVSYGAALMVNFAADDNAFLDVCLGVGSDLPEGRLPFDLPRSQAAVDKSREDVAFDSAKPLFPYGSGLAYNV